MTRTAIPWVGWILPRVRPEDVPFGCGLCEWTRGYNAVAEVKQTSQCPNCRAATLREYAEARAK